MSFADASTVKKHRILFLFWTIIGTPVFEWGLFWLASLKGKWPFQIFPGWLNNAVFLICLFSGLIALIFGLRSGIWIRAP
jgi:hypothetical protein